MRNCYRPVVIMLLVLYVIYIYIRLLFNEINLSPKNMLRHRKNIGHHRDTQKILVSKIVLGKSHSKMCNRENLTRKIWIPEKIPLAF